MAQLAREVVLGQTSAVVDPEEFTRCPPTRNLSRASRLSLYVDPHDLETAAPLLAVSLALHDLSSDGGEAFSKRVRFGINASWFVNILLLFAKVIAFILSGSYAVLASAVDSLVDVLSQAVLAIAEYQAARFDKRFPIGRTRIAELSVLACACIMFVSTSLVIREAAGSLWAGLQGHPTHLTVDAILFGVLGAATTFKLGLYLYCRSLRKNPIMVALSEDHLNDVMSNVAAVAGAVVAGNLPKYWFVDPAVALLFSFLILYNWLKICWEQGQKMIGLGAPDELVREVTDVTTTHNPAMQLDRVTAYHHGSHMVVEVEVIMPPFMTVRESHDIALALQHKIEAIESVERAFVHVDYARRPVEEHKVERNLKLGEKDVMKPMVGVDPGPPGPAWTNRGRSLPEYNYMAPARAAAAATVAAAAAAAGGAAAPPPCGPGSSQHFAEHPSRFAPVRSLVNGSSPGAGGSRDGVCSEDSSVGVASEAGSGSDVEEPADKGGAR